MENLPKNLSICPHNNCVRIPRISFLEDSRKLKIACNEHGASYINKFDVSNYLFMNNDLKNKMICSNCYRPLKENDFFFYCNDCKKFFCNICYQKNIFHEHQIIKRNITNFWNKCLKHDNLYKKYCRTCAISLCVNCDINLHKGHTIIEIEQKNKIEKEKIKQNLQLQKNYLIKVKNMIYNCIEQMESELEYKNLILKNYLNNNDNGNSVENLKDISFQINQHFKSKIDNIDNENNLNSFKDKLLSLHYYNNMINSKQNDEIDIKNTFINEQLYQRVIEHKEISNDLVDIVTIEKDGNCFYRAISYFLFNLQDAHSKIRNKISEKARQDHRDNPHNFNLVENSNLTETQYINEIIQNNGNFAGDYEISIAQMLFNINIAAYRPGNNNNLTFIKFYNDDNNYKRDLLILIFIDNNHFQLAYYNGKKEVKDIKKEKTEEKQKIIENLGLKKLKKEIENKNIKKEKNIPNTPKKNKNIPDKNTSSNIVTKDSKITISSELNVIICMIRLSSGNLALGLSNGKIKIYDVNEICSNVGYYEDEEERDSILTIEKFKGKRISYLYELKNKTLLCGTYSKIHHLLLTNNDRDFEYLGSINISKRELPKKIIELGNDLIVSLGEKIFKNENIKRVKCFLKIFNKVTSSQKQSEDNSFCLFSDNESINSGNSSLSEGWESVYSSNTEDSFKNMNEKNFIIDSHIKLYKNNKNLDGLFRCSIFPLDMEVKKNNGNIYEFIATSNSIFYRGENTVQIFGVLKNQYRHGYTFFIDKTLNDLPCSRFVESIAKLNKNYIGIGLQKTNDCNNSIAVFDINEKEIVNIIEGLSIGLLNKSIFNPKYIIFTTNETKDYRKCNEIRLYKKNNLSTDFLAKNKDKLIFRFISSFSCLVEICSDKNKKYIYYASASNKKLIIIQIENNLDLN